MPLLISTPFASVKKNEICASCVEGLARAIPVLTASDVSVAALKSAYRLPARIPPDSGRPAVDITPLLPIARTIARPAGEPEPTPGVTWSWFTRSDELAPDTVEKETPPLGK